jgi:hypothetical protein
MQVKLNACEQHTELGPMVRTASGTKSYLKPEVYSVVLSLVVRSQLFLLVLPVCTTEVTVVDLVDDNAYSV